MLSAFACSVAASRVVPGAVAGRLVLAFTVSARCWPEGVEAEGVEAEGVEPTEGVEAEGVEPTEGVLLRHGDTEAATQKQHTVSTQKQHTVSPPTTCPRNNFLHASIHQASFLHASRSNPTSPLLLPTTSPSPQLLLHQPNFSF